MQTPIRGIASFAPVAAPLSMIAYGLALDMWPQAAGGLFAALFRLDPWTLQPLEGWAAVLPGVALWVAGCYAAGALGWALWHMARSRQPEALARALPDLSTPLLARRARGQ